MSALATAWVADGQYNDALDYAEEVLKLDETNASALATCAICHGLLNHPHRSAEYTEKAVAAGYSEKKIEDTIKALKK
jgi:cytochrome c553